jgi:hypothetical protein
MISASMRDVLIAHLDGRKVPVIIVPKDDGMKAHRAACAASSTHALIVRGMLRPNTPRHPKYTIITDAGRAALAKLLAEYAEALIRSGYTQAGYEPPIPVSPRQSALPVDALGTVADQLHSLGIASD